MPKSHVWPGAAVLVLAQSGEALAHAPLPGLQGFYRAAPHVFEEPGSLLLFLAVALWCGTAQGRSAEKLVGVLLGALIAGCAAGVLVPAAHSSATIAGLALAALLAVLTTAKIAPSGKWAAVATAVAGFIAGMACAPDAGPLGAVLWSAAGATSGFTAGALLLIALTKRALQPGLLAGIAPAAIRVLAAWTAAASLLSLAFAWRFHP